jgi:hypothetical protein
MKMTIKNMDVDVFVRSDGMACFLHLRARYLWKGMLVEYDGFTGGSEAEIKAQVRRGKKMVYNVNPFDLSLPDDEVQSPIRAPVGKGYA